MAQNNVYFIWYHYCHGNYKKIVATPTKISEALLVNNPLLDWTYNYTKTRDILETDLLPLLCLCADDEEDEESLENCSNKQC